MEKINTVEEALITAKALIADPKHWHQGSFTKGTLPDHELPEDYCMCAWGTLEWLNRYTRCLNYDLRGKADLALIAALPDASGWVPVYNDNPKTTHEDIMALFDRAIESVKADGN
jgi:hypothetical protein